jgi:hypothetical protein
LIERGAGLSSTKEKSPRRSAFRSVVIATLIGATATVLASLITFYSGRNDSSSPPSHGSVHAAASASAFPIFFWLGPLIVAIVLLVIVPTAFVSFAWQAIPLPRATESQAQWLANRIQDSARRSVMRFEAVLIAVLLVLAIAGFAESYYALRSVLTSVQAQRFGPSETAQVIASIGGLGIAIGSAIAGVIKAYALLVHARADFVRAKNELSADGNSAEAERRQLSSSE